MSQHNDGRINGPCKMSDVGSGSIGSWRWRWELGLFVGGMGGREQVVIQVANSNG